MNGLALIGTCLIICMSLLIYTIAFPNGFDLGCYIVGEEIQHNGKKEYLRMGDCE